MYMGGTSGKEPTCQRSVQFSCSVVSGLLWPHGLQHARPHYPSPAPRVYSNPCPLSQWCHPTISSSVIPFSSRLQSLPASGSFQMSQLRQGSIPGSGRSPGGGNDNPLKYSYLGNPMDRGAWQATVHRVAQNWIQLKWLSTRVCTYTHAHTYTHTYMLYIFIYLSVDTWVSSTSWLLWIILLWTWMCKYLIKILLPILLDIYPQLVLMDHMIILFLIFENLPYYFPKWLHHFAIPSLVHKN